MHIVLQDINILEHAFTLKRKNSNNSIKRKYNCDKKTHLASCRKTSAATVSLIRVKQSMGFYECTLYTEQPRQLI